MTSYGDGPSRKYLLADSARASTVSDEPSAQILRFDASMSRRLSKAPPLTDAEASLAALKSDVTMAIGIGRGLGETLVRFQDCLVAIDEEIERGEVTYLKATIEKQAEQLRSTVLAAMDDWRRVLSASADRMTDTAQSDFIGF